MTIYPEVREREVLGLPLPWMVLGGLIYPWFVVCGWWYVRQAERNEDDFADLVDRADSGRADSGRADKAGERA